MTMTLNTGLGACQSLLMVYEIVDIFCVFKFSKKALL